MGGFEEFVAAENAQLSSANPASQQLLGCKEIADGTRAPKRTNSPRMPRGSPVPPLSFFHQSCW
jgi:hypothetical protein